MIVNGVKITKHEFMINTDSGSDSIFLLAGEFHYFRVAQSEWEDRLEKMGEIGCNAVATYIPWNWHEEHEGEFDFSSPEKDLDLFITRCEEHGFYILARPGPWICSEWAYGAIPLWLLYAHPEILCLNEGGQPTKWEDLKAPPVSYLHPLYLGYVRKWFEQVCPIIAAHELPQGRVILVQPDNELSFAFHKSFYDVDYNPIHYSFYREFLETKYDSVDAINRAYGTAFTSLDEIEPPRRADEGGIESLHRLLDWQEYKERVIAEYVSRLVAMMREYGIKSPIYVNTPGLDPPADPITQSLAEQDENGHPIIFVGEDMYPREFEAEVFTDWRIALPVGLLDAYFPYLPFSPEFEGGHFNIPVSPNETQIVSRLGLGHGLKALSIYMMVGGTNPPLPADLKALVDYPFDSYTTIPYTLTVGGEMDHTGAAYDLLAPIGEAGDRNPRFLPFQRFFSLVRANTSQLLVATKVCDGVAFLHNARYDRIKDDTEKFGTLFNYNRMGSIDVMSPSYAFLACASTLHLQPKIVEVSVIHSGSESSNNGGDADELDKFPVAFGFFLDFLEGVAIGRLRRFLDRGGTLIAFFDVPARDERYLPDERLTELIPTQVEKKVEPKAIRMLGHAIDAADFALVYRNLPPDADILAEIEPGEPCAYIAPAGNGRIVHMGFVPPPDDEGIALVRDLLTLAGATNPYSWVSKPGVLAIQQAAPNGERFVTVANLWPRVETVSVRLDDPASTENALIEVDGVRLPARACLVWTVQKQISQDITIVLGTAEILSVESEEGGVTRVHGYNFSGASGNLWIKTPSIPTCNVEFSWDDALNVAKIIHDFPATIEFEVNDARVVFEFDEIDVPPD
ncbi:MAG TPA: beta-galactosidase [Candidatus Lokiarchaeia archaeon]|nr:beta-galactosidase [Candidatus Lokiarchaeia archaeon]